MQSVSQSISQSISQSVTQSGSEIRRTSESGHLVNESAGELLFAFVLKQVTAFIFYQALMTPNACRSNSDTRRDHVGRSTDAATSSPPQYAVKHHRRIYYRASPLGGLKPFGKMNNSRLENLRGERTHRFPSKKCQENILGTGRRPDRVASQITSPYPVQRIICHRDI